jgi:phospholipid transport system substrate-binding protein
MSKYLRSALWIFILISFLFLENAVARQGSFPARDLLEGKINDIIEILKQDELNDSEKRSRIEELVDPVFDYELMAKLTLGRKHWPRLSAEQRRVFVKRFVTRLKDSYLDKVSMYSGGADAGFNYLPVRQQGNKVHVPVEVTAGDDKIDMVYKFYSSADQWKVYDVEINGVSIVQSYMSQFDQILSDGNVDDLLEAVKQVQAPQAGE